MKSQNDYNVYNPSHNNVNQNNYNDLNNPYNFYNNNNFNNNNQYNNYYPNDFNNVNNYHKRRQHQNFFQNPIYHLIPKPFRNFEKKKRGLKPFGMFNPFFEYMKYLKDIHEARKTYNLDNISDPQLLEALKKTNGNIDEAILQLLPK